MNTDITKINELEKRLRAEHEELDSLVASYGSGNDDLVKNKLKYLQAEIDYLNSSVKLLNEVMIEDSLKKETVEELPEVVVAIEDPKYNSTVEETAVTEAAETEIPVEEFVSEEPVLAEEIPSKETPVKEPLPMKIWVREDSPVDFDQTEVKMTSDREEAVQNYLDKVAGKNTEETAPAEADVKEDFEVEETIKIKKIPETVVKKEEKKKKASLENRIGLLVMPILAAALIFISVILLASALPESIGNIIKQITMFVAGFSFVGTGLVLNKKKKGGAFGQILMAIGVGELFVSLVVCRFAFKSISNLWLFILIFIWSVGLVFLKRFSNTLFQIIGEIGISIAVIFGVSYSFANGNHSGLWVITAFYALTTLVFDFVFRFRAETTNVILFHVFNISKIIVLAIGVLLGIANPFTAIGIVGMLIAAVGFIGAADTIFSFKSDSTLDKIVGPVSVVIYSIQIFFTSMFSMMYLLLAGKGYDNSLFDKGITVFFNIIKDSRWMMISVSCIFVILLILLVEFVWKELVPKYCTEAFLSMILLTFLSFSLPTVKYGFIIMMVLLTVLGYARKNHALKIGAVLFYIGYAFLPKEVAFRISVGLAMGIAVVFLLYLTKKQYYFAYKICVYFSLLLYAITVSFTAFRTSNILGIQWIIIFAFASFLNILTMFSGLSKNKEKEADFVIIPELLNIVVTSSSLILSMIINESGGTLGYIPLLIAFMLIIISSFRGFLQNRILCRINSVVALIVGIITLTSFDYSAFWFATIAIALGLTLMYVKKERYYFAEKVTYFVLLLIYPGVCVHYFRDLLLAKSGFAIWAAVAAGLVLLFKFTFLSKDGERDKNDFEWVTFGAGAFVTLVTMPLISLGEITNGFTVLAFAVMAVMTFVWLINGFLTGRNKEKFAVLSVILLTFCIAFGCEGFELVFTVFIAVTAAAWLVLLYLKRDTYNFLYKVAMYIEILLGCIVIPCLFRDSLSDIKYLGVEGIILLAVTAVTLLFKFTGLAKDPNTDEEDISIVTFCADIATVLYAQLLVGIFEGDGNYVSTAVLALIICIWLIQGFVSKKLMYKIAFIASMFMMAIFAWAFVPAMYVIITGVLIIMFFVLLYITDKEYLFWLKIPMFTLAMLQAVICPLLYRTSLEKTEVFVTANVAFLALAIINTLFRFTPLAKNPETDADDMSFITFIISQVLVITGLVITFAYEGPADILSGVLTLALIPIGTVWIWNKEESLSVTIGKYAFVTEYVFVPFLLCYAFTTPAYVSSIIGIVLSVGCIVLGFATKMKGIRIYGLIISMIMIFKLSLIDFEKSSVLAYSLSFLIAGISCLIISMLYHFVNAAVEKNKIEAE